MTPNVSQKEIAECYQPLFDLMDEQFSKILTVSEMDEIILASLKVSNSLDELFKDVCDVEGCTLTPSNGGGCWRETGYWSVCQIHSTKFRNGESQPAMKKQAIERESTRMPDGCLPNHPENN